MCWWDVQFKYDSAPRMYHISFEPETHIMAQVSAVLPATFSIPAVEKNLSVAIGLATKCLHNSQISGNFTVCIS